MECGGRETVVGELWGVRDRNKNRFTRRSKTVASSRDTGPVQRKVNEIHLKFL